MIDSRRFSSLKDKLRLRAEEEGKKSRSLKDDIIKDKPASIEKKKKVVSIKSKTTKKNDKTKKE